jgi:hypothetical protein
MSAIIPLLIDNGTMRSRRALAVPREYRCELRLALKDSSINNADSDGVTRAITGGEIPRLNYSMMPKRPWNPVSLNAVIRRIGCIYRQGTTNAVLGEKEWLDGLTVEKLMMALSASAA